MVYDYSLSATHTHKPTHKHAAHAHTQMQLTLSFVNSYKHAPNTHRKGGLAMCETEHGFHKVPSHNNKV